jgi:hypothetical protein
MILGGGQVMQCENEYCIYNRENKCLFETAAINSVGMCDDCIIISLDRNFLEFEKARQFQEIEKRWEKINENTLPSKMTKIEAIKERLRSEGHSELYINQYIKGYLEGHKIVYNKVYELIKSGISPNEIVRIILSGEFSLLLKKDIGHLL